MNRLVVLIPAFLISCADIYAQRPNIIYIMSDDLGYGDLGSYGSTTPTPNIDKLAAGGMKFTNAYAAAPLCTPTRTALMTGKYPARTTVGLMEPLTASKNDSAYGLSAGEASIAGRMKEMGYSTALIGKWHLGFKPEYSPNKNGFEYFYGMHSGAADYISHKGNGRRIDFYENENLKNSEGYLTHIFTDKAVEFMVQERNKPFFLVLTYNAPHWPWQEPGDLPYEDSVDFRKGGSREKYLAMIKAMDEGIGRIMKVVDSLDRLNNTVIVFTNDNGGERYSDHGGLSGAKATLHEGGIRVPAIVSWAGKIPPGAVSGELIITMDWMPTFLALAGAINIDRYTLDGINILPVCLNNAVLGERVFFWRSFQRSRENAVIRGKWKYLKNEQGSFLFDLSLDKEEKNDLKNLENETLEELKRQFAEWEKSMLKPIPLQG